MHAGFFHGISSRDWHRRRTIHTCHAPSADSIRVRLGPGEELGRWDSISREDRKRNCRKAYHLQSAESGRSQLGLRCRSRQRPTSSCIPLVVLSSSSRRPLVVLSSSSLLSRHHSIASKCGDTHQVKAWTAHSRACFRGRLSRSLFLLPNRAEVNTLPDASGGLHQGCHSGNAVGRRGFLPLFWHSSCPDV